MVFVIVLAMVRSRSSDHQATVKFILYGGGSTYSTVRPQFMSTHPDGMHKLLRAGASVFYRIYGTDRLGAHPASLSMSG